MASPGSRCCRAEGRCSSGTLSGLHRPRQIALPSGFPLQRDFSFSYRGNNMKFEHLIAINDPLNPLIEPLTRLQLWRGLVLRAEAPQLYVPQLDECQLSERTPNAVSRVLRYGELAICDRVTFLPQQQVHYQIPPQNEIAASSLCMRIEEPQPELLFVRFTYDDSASAAEDEANAMYDSFRRSAYQEADIDTIRLIRELAAEGRFDTPLC